MHDKCKDVNWPGKEALVDVIKQNNPRYQEAGRRGRGPSRIDHVGRRDGIAVFGCRWGKARH